MRKQANTLRQETHLKVLTNVFNYQLRSRINLLVVIHLNVMNMFIFYICPLSLDTCQLKITIPSHRKEHSCYSKGRK